jgi:hypothetical protein
MSVESISYQLNREDIEELFRVVYPWRSRMFLFLWPIFVGIGIGGYVLAGELGKIVGLASMVFALICFSLWLRFRPKTAISTAIRRYPGLFTFEPNTLELLPEGVKTSRGFIHWKAVIRIVEGPERLFLFLDRFRAVIVPKRAFEGDSEFRRFAKVLERYRGDVDTVEATFCGEEGDYCYRYEFALTPADYRALGFHVTPRGIRNWVVTALCALLGGFSFLVAGVDFAFRPTTEGVLLVILASVLLAFAVMIGPVNRWLLPPFRIWLAMRRNAAGYPLTEQVLEIGPSGLRTQSEKGRAEVPWWRLHRVDFTDDHIFLMLTDQVAIILPCRALGERRASDLSYEFTGWLESAVPPRKGVARRAPEAGIPDPFAPPSDG